MAEYDFLKQDKARKHVPGQKEETPQKASLNSEQASVLDLQRMIGNQNVQRMLSPGKSDTRQAATFIQTKLTVGPVNDQYEQEADRVASEVVNTPVEVQRQGEEEEIAQAKPDFLQRQDEEEEIAQAKPDFLQRQDEEEEIAQAKPDFLQRQDEEEEIAQAKPDFLQRQDEEEEIAQAKPNFVQRQEDGGFEVGGDVEEQIQSQKGGGQSLSDDSRGFFEDRFGYDFGGVNVHTDAQSDTLNRSISARAFTTGSDIFFRQGEYDPGSKSGQELIAHELTHVVQQGGAVQKEDAEKKK